MTENNDEVELAWLVGVMVAGGVVGYAVGAYYSPIPGVEEPMAYALGGVMITGVVSAASIGFPRDIRR